MSAKSHESGGKNAMNRIGILIVGSCVSFVQLLSAQIVQYPAPDNLPHNDDFSVKVRAAGGEREPSPSDKSDATKMSHQRQQMTKINTSDHFLPLKSPINRLLAG